jgi:hypothetical protein
VAKLNEGKLSWKQTCGHAEHLLGIIYAPDEKAAEAAPVAEFNINEDMRRRLIVEIVLAGVLAAAIVLALLVWFGR